MNDLSFYLYLTHIFKSIDGLILFISVIGMLTCLILIVILFEDNYYVSDKDKKFRTKLLKNLYLFLIGLNFIGIFIPSEKTMYLMLASEVNEEVLASETGQKAYKILNQKLDEMINATQTNG